MLSLGTTAPALEQDVPSLPRGRNRILPVAAANGRNWHGMSMDLSRDIEHFYYPLIHRNSTSYVATVGTSGNERNAQRAMISLR